MKISMKYIIFLILLSGILVNALIAKEEDIFSTLKINDHVVLTIKNGHVFSGIIKYMKKDRIILDVSYDDPALKGTITFYRDNIKNIESLMPLTDVEKKRIISEKESRLKSYRQEIKEKKAEVLVETAPQPAEEIDQENLSALLEKFPPEDGWSLQKKNDILQKVESLRSEDEKEFLTVFDDWSKALALKGKEDQASLLEKFPPGKVWSKEKYTEITTRIARIKVGPSKEEQEFVDNFDAWEKALEEKKQEEAAKEKQEPEQKEEQPSPESEPQK